MPGPYLNGFIASVVVNDTEVPHYAVDVDEDSRTLTCWIPSVPGENFSVTWRCLKGFMDTRGEVYVDGSSVGSEVIRRQIYKGMKGKFSVVEMGHMPRSNFQPFSFSDVPVDGLDTPSSEPTPHLGEIQIVIHQIDPRINRDRKKKDGENEEEAKTTQDDRIERVATFIFKYRTLEILEAQSILSREATYRPTLALPSGSSSEVPLPGQQIALPNYRELFSSSSDRATNKRKYEEIMAHDDDNLDHEIRRLQARVNELHAIRRTITRVKNPGPGRHRKPRFLYDMLKNGAVAVEQEEIKSEPA